MTRADRARKWATNGFVGGAVLNTMTMCGNIAQGNPAELIPLMIFFPALIGGILGLAIKSSH